MRSLATICLAVLFLLSSQLSPLRAQSVTCDHVVNNQQSFNESLMSAIWKHLNAGAHDQVIACFNEMADKFDLAAPRLQTSLQTNGCPYPVGAVNDEKLREKIFRNGVLNDMASAYFAVGQSHEKLRQYDEARQVYGKCVELTCARTWDPKGWFWSPAHACADRLVKLPNRQ
tara:strand:+ start:254 stop:769 length:516 start_codon:yes stop_codon:yes gene_type:complete